jgi:hypothetical protein
LSISPALFPQPSHDVPYAVDPPSTGAGLPDRVQTSDPCGLSTGLVYVAECGCFVVDLSGLEAVVEAAEHAVEGVTQCWGVVFAVVAASVVAGADTRRGQRGERPAVADGGQPAVLTLR